MSSENQSENTTEQQVPALIPELNVTEWRQMVSDYARGLRDGTITPANANALANLMGKTTQTYRLQLDYAKAIGARPYIDALMPPTRE